MLLFLVLLVLRAPSSWSTVRAASRKYASRPQRSPDSPIQFRPASFDWSSAHQFHPPDSIKPLPVGKPRELPRVQAPNEAFASSSAVASARRDAVRKTFRRSYGAYRKHAWLRDELMPVSGQAKDPFCGWAASLVDSLDTLWIMDLEDEFIEAAAAAAAIDWSKTPATSANVFETTIRHLGGLLAAYDLSQEPALLQKALELGEMLYVAFDTPNRLPGFWLNWGDARRGYLVAGYNDASASPASLCLELTRLSQLTGDPKFYDAADRVTRFLERTQGETSLPGMWPMTLDFMGETAQSNVYTLGAAADSLYECLPKMHALLGGLDPTYGTMYRKAMDVVEQHLLFRPMTPTAEDVLFLGDAYVRTDEVRRSATSQHLTCFAGGMFGLGARLLGEGEHRLQVGAQLARGCGWAYSQFPTGIMPEVFTMVPCPTLERCRWDEELWNQTGHAALPRGFSFVRDSRYILRPEAIESIFIMYRVTGNPEWQDWAWAMFQSIVRATETRLANSAILDVTIEGETKKTDSMEVRQTKRKSGRCIWLTYCLLASFPSL